MELNVKLTPEYKHVPYKYLQSKQLQTIIIINNMSTVVLLLQIWIACRGVPGGVWRFHESHENRTFSELPLSALDSAARFIM